MSLVVSSPSPLSFFQVHMLFVICALSWFMSSCFSTSSASLSVMHRTVRKAFVQGWKNTEC